MDGNAAFKLSSDLVMLIMQCLNPIDIVAMRTACRMFYKAAASRSVWIAALDRVCSQHGIFRPTYPTEKMTLAELEHAASGPRRFVKFVNAYKSAPKSETEPAMTRIIPCRKDFRESGASDGLYDVRGLLLIPGGRFLVIFGGSFAAGNICLWDLGYNVYSPVKPFPRATVRIDDDLVGVTASQNTEGNMIILAVATRGMESPAVAPALTVYQIDPLSPNPEFLPVAGIRLEPVWTGSMQYTSMSDSTVIIKSQKRVAAWNWVEGTGCQWQLSTLSSDALTTEQDIATFGKTIISLDEAEHFVIWEMPDELPRISIDSTLPIITNGPKYVRRRYEENEYASIDFAATCAWQQHTQPHLCSIENIEEDLNDDSRFSLYSIRHVGGHDRAFLPTKIPVEGYEGAYTFTPGDPITNALSPLFLCDSRLVMCTRGRAQLIATVLPITTESSGIATLIDPASALLLTVDEGEYLFADDVGFCPMSGRIVIPISDTSIQITDFLLPFKHDY